MLCFAATIASGFMVRHALTFTPFILSTSAPAKSSPERPLLLQVVPTARSATVASRSVSMHHVVGLDHDAALYAAMNLSLIHI